MQTSNFLPKLFGFFYIVMPLAVILNRNLIKKIIQVMNNEVILFYGGVVNFVIGLAIILGYHPGIYNWRVIITIIGWLAILKGLFYMFFPSIASRLIAKIKIGKGMIIYMIILILLGISLVFAGFVGSHLIIRGCPNSLPWGPTIPR